ncbi:MAG: uL30 family ribosomal protein [Candidatus Aenigmatarchaeota archaeon]
MYAVVRLRGKVGVRDEFEDTLRMLNLKDKFACTFLPETKDYEGMLKKVKNFVTWGEVDKETAEEIINKKGDMENAEEVIEILEKDRNLSEMERRSFPLSPPSGGFKKPTNKLHPNGEAGYRGEEIIPLLKNMV